MNTLMFFAQAAQEAAKPTAQQGAGGMGMLVPMLLIFAIFYFMLISVKELTLFISLYRCFCILCIVVKFFHFIFPLY